MRSNGEWKQFFTRISSSNPLLIIWRKKIITFIYFLCLVFLFFLSLVIFLAHFFFYFFICALRILVMFRKCFHANNLLLFLFSFASLLDRIKLLLASLNCYSSHLSTNSKSVFFMPLIFPISVNDGCTLPENIFHLNEAQVWRINKDLGLFMQNVQRKLVWVRTLFWVK